MHSIPATIGGGAPTAVTIAAGSVSTSQVQHGCSSAAICGTEGSTALTFGTTFSTPPALLLQIQSTNGETGTPPGGVSIPFLTSTVVEDAGGNP